MAKRYAPKQDPAKKEAPSEAADAVVSTPGVLNPDLVSPAEEAAAESPGKPAPAEASAIGPGANAATSKTRTPRVETSTAAPAEAEPVDAAHEASPASPRRRPITLDLPAKDLTPPPPPPPRPEPQAAAAEAAGAGVASAEKSHKRQSLGLVGASILALAAGLMGGAVAFALVSTFYSAEQNIDSITELEARALDLRQRVERLETQPAPAAPTVVASVPAELSARIEALEGGLTAADAKLTEADNRIAALAEAPAPVAAPAASPEALQQAETRIAGLEGRLNEVTAQRQTGAEAARAAAALATLGALEAAMAAGVPYEAELQASRTLLGEKAAGLSALEAAASTGLPAGPALAGRLKAALAEAPASSASAGAAAPADAGLVDKLWNSASSLVSVRRNSGAEDASSEPALAAAQDALGRGDVAEALTILGGLPEASKQKLAAVIGAMEARQAALATVAGVKRQLIADIAGRTP